MYKLIKISWFNSNNKNEVKNEINKSWSLDKWTEVKFDNIDLVWKYKGYLKLYRTM